MGAGQLPLDTILESIALRPAKIRSVVTVNIEIQINHRHLGFLLITATITLCHDRLTSDIRPLCRKCLPMPRGGNPNPTPINIITMVRWRR